MFVTIKILIQILISMAAIIGIDGMTAKDLNTHIENGAKFVIYMYCVSVVVMSFKRYSDFYFIMPGEKSSKYASPFNRISLLAGWWGIPWGPIWTIKALRTNKKGGVDMTAQVAAQLKSQVQ
jgi:hypothetical protein